MRAMVNIAVNAARQAGDMIARASQDVSRVKIEAKGKNDFVTHIDLKAESIIIEVLQEAYPNHTIISEEAGEMPGEYSEHVWVVDPLDGTRNFIRGIAHYAVSIAKLYRGKVEHAVIYNPVTQDLYTASQGEGAKLNSKRIRVSEHLGLPGSVISTGITRVTDVEHQLKCLSALHDAPAVLRHCGSIALDLAMVASGALDGIWYYNTPLWDFAAGSLLVREAGGMVMETDGGVNYLESGNILAGTPKVTKALLKLLST